MRTKEHKQLVAGGKQSDVLLFQIRLKNSDRDIIVVDGNESKNNVQLKGSIVLSLSKPMTIKNIRLKINGVLRVKCSTNIDIPNIKDFNLPVDITKLLYYQEVKSLSSSHQFQNQRCIRKAGIKGYELLSSKSSSTSNIADMNTHLSAHTYSKGNYEFPFQVPLNGSIPESIEGQKSFAVIYNIEAIIERGLFSPDLTTRKHFRIIHTPPPVSDDIESLIPMGMSNTWPEKADYSVSVPNKMAAIGSGIPFSISVVPLLKGLKLGNIKVKLLEKITINPTHTSLYEEERVVSSLILPPPEDVNGDLDIINEIRDNSSLNDFSDRWNINATIEIPPTLLKCSPDCNISTNIKVRHNLKFIISLLNPDGHISEILTGLTFSLFISPEISIVAPIDPEQCLVDLDNINDKEDNFERLKNIITETVFPNRNCNISANSSRFQLQDLQKYRSFPPPYSNYIYDKRLDDAAIGLDSARATLDNRLIPRSNFENDTINLSGTHCDCPENSINNAREEAARNPMSRCFNTVANGSNLNIAELITSESSLSNFSSNENLSLVSTLSDISSTAPDDNRGHEISRSALDPVNLSRVPSYDEIEQDKYDINEFEPTPPYEGLLF